MATIEVHADHTYPVVVGRNLTSEISKYLGNATSVAFIYPQTMRGTADAIRAEISGTTSIAIEIPDAEEAKTASVLEFCWLALGQAGFTRNDLIVSVGGGATTDLAGFVAATWLRGIRVLHVPTTLLAMVDAAVGGKTGINTAEGKNLAGAIHSPTAVICDLNSLETQDQVEYVGGLAEVIKAGFIRDPKILELIESNPIGAASPLWEYAQEIIERAIQVKADVVRDDLRETLGTPAGREILNYGHTFGHAIERTERYTWRHGAAVSVGMMFAAHLSHLSGRLPSEVLERHRSILTSVGLPVTYQNDDWETLLDAMKIDKKSRGATLRFVVLDDVARPAILEGPDSALLIAAFNEVVQAN